MNLWKIIKLSKKKRRVRIYESDDDKENSNIIPKKTRKAPTCKKCRAHGKIIDLKGHKSNCEFEFCYCEKCVAIDDINGWKFFDSIRKTLSKRTTKIKLIWMSFIIFHNFSYYIAHNKISTELKQQLRMANESQLNVVKKTKMNRLFK